jgi:hypothetical protein
MDNSEDRRDRGGRPWSVTVGVLLLLVYEAVYLDVGLYALLYGSWEDLAGLGTIFGLTLGLVGLVYLAFTVPAVLGRSFARIVLTVLTVPVVAAGVRWAVLLIADPPDYTYNAGYWVLVTIGPPVSTLFPLLAVVLLYMPPSRAFFARRRRRGGPIGRVDVVPGV